MKIAADSMDCTTVNAATLFQKNWLIESAKGEKDNCTTSGVLVHREIKHTVYCRLSVHDLKLLMTDDEDRKRHDQ